MSGERYLEEFEVLRKQFITITRRSMEENTLDDYKQVDETFRAILDDPELGDGEEVITGLEEDKEELVRQRREMEAELVELEHQLAVTDAQLQRRLAGEAENSVTDVSEELAQAQDLKVFSRYCSQVSELSAGLAVAKMSFNSLLAKSVEDIREGRVCATDVRFAEPDVWAVRREQLAELLSEAQGRASQLNWSPPIVEETLYDEVEQLAEAAMAHVAAAEESRRARDAQLVVFNAECGKVTRWCRQQLANLDAMQEPDHVQEYCRTLADSYGTMGSNLAALLASVSPLVRANHLPARAALREVNEVWYLLLLSALERLTRTLFEIHPQSPLEDEVEKYAQHPKNLANFVAAVRSLLETEKAGLTEESESLLKECSQLEKAMSAAQGSRAVGHVRAFATRVRHTRSAYACLKEAILARLTFVSPPADIVTESQRRQNEFEECIRELKSWATAQAHGESWRDIYSKIVEIKRVIEREQEYIEERAGAPAE